jgi:hypothetical protein
LLIISYFEAFFLKETMNISDSLHKLRISHRMSFSHYKQEHVRFSNLRWLQDRNIFSTLVLKTGTTFLTAALPNTEATPRTADQLPQ